MNRLYLCCKFGLSANVEGKGKYIFIIKLEMLLYYHYSSMQTFIYCTYIHMYIYYDFKKFQTFNFNFKLLIQF